MIQRFKAFWCSCSVLFLSLYCRAVLAVDQAVNTAAPGQSPVTAPVPTPAVPVPPAADLTSSGALVPAKFADKQVLEGLFVMIGSMLMMIGLGWFVLSLLGRIFGQKTVLKKPLIIGAVGIVLIAVGRQVVK